MAFGVSSSQRMLAENTCEFAYLSIICSFTAIVCYTQCRVVTTSTGLLSIACLDVGEARGLMDSNVTDDVRYVQNVLYVPLWLKRRTITIHTELC